MTKAIIMSISWPVKHNVFLNALALIFTSTVSSVSVAFLNIKNKSQPTVVATALLRPSILSSKPLTYRSPGYLLPFHPLEKLPTQKKASAQAFFLDEDSLRDTSLYQEVVNLLIPVITLEPLLNTSSPTGKLPQDPVEQTIF